MLGHYASVEAANASGLLYSVKFYKFVSSIMPKILIASDSLRILSFRFFQVGFQRVTELFDIGVGVKSFLFLLPLPNVVNANVMSQPLM